MKKLVLLVVILLTGCNSKPATKVGGPVSAQIDVNLHTLAIKASANGDKVCYQIPEPNAIAGQYCLEYRGK